MNVSKMTPVTFKGVFYPPKTEEWKKAKEGNRRLSQTTSDLGKFVEKKLDPTVTVRMNHNADEGTIAVHAMNERYRDRKKHTVTYPVADFAQHSGNNSSLRNKLIALNA